MSGGRRALALCLAAVASACAPQPPPPATGAAQRLRLETDRVEFGRAVEFEVLRTHASAYDPEAWSEPFADGLRVELRDARTQTRADSVSERRRYRLRALSPAAELTVVLPAWSVRARADGGVAVAPEQRHTLRVVSSLPAADAGQFELPLELAARSGVHPGWWFLLAGAAIWAAWRLRAARVARPAAVAPPPARMAGTDEARARLRTLRGRAVTDRVTDRAFHDEAAAIARAWGAARGVAGPAALTREELARAWRGRPGGPELDAVMSACEQVQFARARSTAEARERLLQDLARAVEVEG